MAKVYVNPIDESRIDFKKILGFMAEARNQNNKLYFLVNVMGDEDLILRTNPKIFGTEECYVLNKNTVTSLEIIAETEIKQKSVIKRAIVGGILTGGIGAVVGAVSGLQPGYKGIRKIKINDKFEFKIDDKNFKIVSEFFIKLEKELNNSLSSKEENMSSDNPLEKLKELKELLDLNIITQEEFEEKKAKLMEQI